MDTKVDGVYFMVDTVNMKTYLSIHAFHQHTTAARRWFAIALLPLMSACASVWPDSAQPRFQNIEILAGDTGQRAPVWYFLRRAWVQITRDEATTPLPQTRTLDLTAMSASPLSVAWLGHASVLVHANGQWILIDPVFSDYITPLPPFGPKRLTPFPIDPRTLPHISYVLISHDHPDHLDLPTVRALQRQVGGPPQFLVGAGQAGWFDQYLQTPVREFQWWDTLETPQLSVQFTPAHHSSGRRLGGRNSTLWGGWLVRLQGGGASFYFAGDTAWSPRLIDELSTRLGRPDIAAIPIGAYRPRKWMQYEHVDPAEALTMHARIGARRSFGIHWATFQLGDEEPIQPQLDLADARQRTGITGFFNLDIGEPLAVDTLEARHENSHSPPLPAHADSGWDVRLPER